MTDYLSSLYRDNEKQTHRFILNAIDHFSQLHHCLPQLVVLEFWRRVTALADREWISLPVEQNCKIYILSPQDNRCPAPLVNVSLSPDVALCFRALCAEQPIDISTVKTQRISPEQGKLVTDALRAVEPARRITTEEQQIMRNALAQQGSPHEKKRLFPAIQLLRDLRTREQQ